MSFEHSRTVRTSASCQAVWALWSTPATWPVWDPAVTAVALDGEVEQGVEGVMTLAGGIEVPVLLEVVEPGTRYVDRLTLGELVIRIDHVVVEAPDGAGSEVTVSTTVTGPGADDVGPMVTHEAPLAMARLVEMAESA